MAMNQFKYSYHSNTLTPNYLTIARNNDGLEFKIGGCMSLDFHIFKNAINLFEVRMLEMCRRRVVLMMWNLHTLYEVRLVRSAL